MNALQLKDIVEPNSFEWNQLCLNCEQYTLSVTHSLNPKINKRTLQRRFGLWCKGNVKSATRFSRLNVNRKRKSDPEDNNITFGKSKKHVIKSSTSTSDSEQEAEVQSQSVHLPESEIEAQTQSVHLPDSDTSIQVEAQTQSVHLPDSTPSINIQIKKARCDVNGILIGNNKQVFELDDISVDSEMQTNQANELPSQPVDEIQSLSTTSIQNNQDLQLSSPSQSVDSVHNQLLDNVDNNQHKKMEKSSNIITSDLFTNLQTKLLTDVDTWEQNELQYIKEQASDTRRMITRMSVQSLSGSTVLGQLTARH